MSKDEEIERLRKQVEKEKKTGEKKAIGVAIVMSGLVLVSLNHGEGLAVVGYIIFLVGAYMMFDPYER